MGTSLCQQKSLLLLDYVATMSMPPLQYPPRPRTPYYAFIGLLYVLMVQVFAAFIHIFKDVVRTSLSVKEIQTCAFEDKNFSHPKHMLCDIKKNHLDDAVCSIQTHF